MAASRRKVFGRRAFTLIELLTVIAILSTLAAFLFPVLAGAKRHAASATCLSNLRSAGQALMMYNGDYDDVYPNRTLLAFDFQYAYADQLVHEQYCRCERRTDEEFMYCWLTAIEPYLTLSELRCPMDILPHHIRGFSSYEYKLDLAYNGIASRIEKPSKVAVVWEKRAYHQPGRESEYDARASLNVLLADGSTDYKSLGRATSTLYGDGPDLHFLFPGVGPDLEYQGEDFVD